MTDQKKHPELISFKNICIIRVIKIKCNKKALKILKKKLYKCLGQIFFC